MKEIERVQTGVRIEKRTLKVLKGLAEYLESARLGDLLEGIVLHAFEGNAPFSMPRASRSHSETALWTGFDGRRSSQAPRARRWIRRSRIFGGWHRGWCFPSRRSCPHGFRVRAHTFDEAASAFASRCAAWRRAGKPSAFHNDILRVSRGDRGTQRVLRRFRTLCRPIPIFWKIRACAVAAPPTASPPISRGRRSPCPSPRDEPGVGFAVVPVLIAPSSPMSVRKPMLECTAICMRSFFRAWSLRRCSF